MLKLDHASLQVSDLSRTRHFLEDGLGFNISLTLQAPQEHGRIFLDRGYVEVSQAGQSGGLPDRRPPLSAWSGYFLRTADPGALISEARARGVELSEPAIYHGRDGDWDDIQILRPDIEKLLPLIVRRLTPQEIAVDWPPKLVKPHPNGAETLESVYLLAGGRREARDLAGTLSRLITGRGATREWVTNPMLQTMASTIRFSDGKGIIVAFPEGAGRAEKWLGRHGPGIFAVGLGTRDLEETEAYLRQGSPATVLSSGDDSATLWLEPGDELDSHMYFSQL